MRKLFIFLSICLLILSLLSSCKRHPFTNPLDPESDDYIGAESIDIDGDGIGQWEDVDDIVLLSPSTGSAVTTITPTLAVYKFNPEKITKYWIQISTDNNDFDGAIIFTKDDYLSNACSVPVGELGNNTLYYWRAIAYDGSKWSDNWSEVRSFIVDIDMGVPQNPSPTNGSIINNTTPTLDWEDVTGADGYHIQVNTDIGFTGTVIANDDTLTASQYPITGVLSDNTTCYWHVKIKNEDGVWGDWSSTWIFTIDIAPPTAPSPSNGSTIIDTTPLLYWEDVASADGYHIQVNTDSSFTGAFIANVDTLTVSQYPITGVLSDNTTCYWHVKIKNEDGVWGDWSSTWSFTVDESCNTSAINSALGANGQSMQMSEIIAYGSQDTWNSMTLTSYAISVTEVTQGDYQAIMGSNPASGYGVGDNYPVYYVTWYDTVKFCNALSILIGLEPVYNESTGEADFTKNGFYLPTEAQWEYAAGGPSHYTWSLSDTFDTWDYACSVSPQDLNGTIEVKSHPANGFGLYDMSGNVRELCHDWYGSTFPHTGETDPDGPISSSYRCLRGGSWGHTDSSYLRCDYRNSSPPGAGYSFIGFRVTVGGHGLW